MKETPAYEKYPVSEEEMGKRYKNWTEGQAYQMMLLYRVGKETGGEKFIERLKEEYFKLGRQSARLSMKLTGTTKEDFEDCSNLPKIHLPGGEELFHRAGFLRCDFRGVRKRCRS